MALIKHQHVIDKIAFVNGLISGLALYPQAWVTLTQGSGNSCSPWAYNAGNYIHIKLFSERGTHSSKLSLRDVNLLAPYRHHVRYTDLLLED
jgi:hypothetical protein